MQARRFAFGPFVLDAEAGALLCKGEPVPLGYRAMLLLTAFLDRPGEVRKRALMAACRAAFGLD
jgi:DNA-binding winged helix-turn-helix (wHTH) protein